MQNHIYALSNFCFMHFVIFVEALWEGVKLKCMQNHIYIYIYYLAIYKSLNAKTTKIKGYLIINFILIICKNNQPYRIMRSGLALLQEACTTSSELDT